MSTTPTDYPAKRDLTSGSLSWNLFRLAAPITTGSLVQALYGLVDAFWLGKWSNVALAAPGVSMPFVFVVITLAWGFSTAGTALVAQYVGSGQHRMADRAAAQMLVLLCAIATFSCTVVIILAPLLLRITRVPTEAIPAASIYLRIAVSALPFTIFTMGYGSILRALGDTITVVIITVCASLLNMVLDPILIFGWWGVPALGTGGAALASLISLVMGALACYVCLRRGRAGLHITLADLKPDWPLLRRNVAIGLPLALGNSSGSIGFTCFQTMINSLGTTVISAYTIGFRVIRFFNVPPMAMAMAATPVVGQALGAGKAGLARRAVRVSVGVVALVMFLPVALLIWRGHLVAAAFIHDDAVIAETSRFFMVVPASSYFFGVLMVLMAAFHGSGHTRPAMVLSVVRMWLFRLPAAYVLAFALGWGSIGVYVGMVIGNVLGALIALWLFTAGHWESAVVPIGTDASKGPAPAEV